MTHPAQERTTSGVSFGEALRELRAAKGWSLRALAGKVQYNYSYLGKVERGEKPPTLEVARLCDKALDSNGKLVSLLSARPAQLPPVVHGFVGRHRETETIRGVLQPGGRAGAPPLIMISGPPGAGKTALALKTAHDAAELYPDGQLYADLRGHAPSTCAPLGAQTVLEEFLRALEVPEIPAGVTEKSALFRSILAHKRILVVLDNAASTATIEPLLPAARTCATMITSRIELSGLAIRYGGRRVTLSRMSVQESLTLLREVIGVRVDREYSAARRLVDLCGGLPLALRIAAERVAGDLMQPIAGLLGELEDERYRLDALSTTGEDSSTMRAVISWSYHKLEADSAQVFRHLAVHRGPDLSVAATAALVGMPARQTRQVLRDLASHHLIEATTYDRFRLHDLLRVFAASHDTHQDTPQSRKASAGRLAGWYLRSMREASRALAPHRATVVPTARPEPAGEHETFRDEGTALSWCDTEARNLAPVVQLALDAGHAEVAWQLAVATRHWLDVRQQCVADAQAILDAGLAAARLAHNAAAQASLETVRGDLLRVNGQLDDAAHAYSTAVTTLRRIEKTHGQPEALLGLALIALENSTLVSDRAASPRDQASHGSGHEVALDARTELATARATAREALRLFLQLEDRQGAAEAVSVLADSDRIAGAMVGDPDRAEKQLTEALHMVEDLDRAHPTRGNIHLRLSALFLSRSDLDAALDHVRAAVTAYRAAQDRFGVADALVREAEICQHLGDSRAMRAALFEAWRLYDDVLDVRAAAIGRRLQATAPRTDHTVDNAAGSAGVADMVPHKPGSSGTGLRRRATDLVPPTTSATAP